MMVAPPLRWLAPYEQGSDRALHSSAHQQVLRAMNS